MRADRLLGLIKRTVGLVEPAYAGTRHFDLVAGLTGDVRDKAVVIDSDGEFGQVAKAAAAGAAAVVLVRAPGQNPWVTWDANALERLPIPAVVAGNDVGRSSTGPASPAPPSR